MPLFDQVFLFALALLAGTFSSKPRDFWCLGTALVLAFCAFFLNWWNEHGYLSVFKPPVREYFASIVVSVFVGAFIGGAFFSSQSMFNYKEPPESDAQRD